MFSRLFLSLRTKPWVAATWLFFATLGFALLSLGLIYESARRDWQNTLMPGTLGPCLRLGGFGLPSDTPTVLLAGDSRMRHGAIPAHISATLHKRTRNIAEQLNLGGDLSTLVLTLRSLSPRSREAIALLVLNLTADGLDDANSPSLTGTEFNRFSLLDQGLLAKQNPSGFWRQASRILWPNQWQAWKRHGPHAPSSCDEVFELSQRDARGHGFTPVTRKAATGPKGKEKRIRFRPPQTQGLRYSHALQNLRDLSALVPRLVLFFPPIDTSECQGDFLSRICAAEMELPRRIAGDLPALEKRIINAMRPAPLGLGPDRFVDLYHLDSLGAELLSRALADSLRSRGFAAPSS